MPPSTPPPGESETKHVQKKSRQVRWSATCVAFLLHTCFPSACIRHTSAKHIRICVRVCFKAALPDRNWPQRQVQSSPRAPARVHEPLITAVGRFGSKFFNIIYSLYLYYIHTYTGKSAFIDSFRSCSADE